MNPKNGEILAYASYPTFDPNTFWKYPQSNMKNWSLTDKKQMEKHFIMEIPRRKDNIPVRVTTSMQDLVERATYQNFVPVVDDRGVFIGIITRKDVLLCFS